MSSCSNPVVVWWSSVTPSNPRSPKTSEIHLDVQLLHIIRVAPTAVGFEELATALLALVSKISGGSFPPPKARHSIVSPDDARF